MRTTIEIDDDLLDQALILHRDRDFELIASMAPLDIDYFSFQVRRSRPGCWLLKVHGSPLEC